MERCRVISLEAVHRGLYPVGEYQYFAHWGWDHPLQKETAMTTQTDNLLLINKDTEFEDIKSEVRNSLTMYEQLDEWSAGAGRNLVEACDVGDTDRLKGMIADLVGDLTSTRQEAERVLRKLSLANDELEEKARYLDSYGFKAVEADENHQILRAVSHACQLTLANMGYVRKNCGGPKFLVDESYKKELKVLEKLDRYLQKMFQHAAYDLSWNRKKGLKKLRDLNEKAINLTIENRDMFRVRPSLEGLWSIEDLLDPAENREAELEREVARLRSIQ